MSIKKNTLWNLFGSAIPMLMGVVCVPFILKRVGVERLGVLTLVWAIIGYFSVFDFGLGRALTQKISSLLAGGQRSQCREVVRSGLVMITTTGVVGAGLLVLLLQINGVQWLNVTSDLVSEVHLSVLIAAIAIPATTMTSGLKGILEGMEDFAIANIYKFILGTANFLSPLLSIYFYGSSLPAIVSFLVASRLFVMFLHMISVRKRVATRFGHGTESMRVSRELLSFGSWMTLSNLLSPLMVVADRFVISAIAGATLVAYYTVPSEFMTRLLILPAALTTALFPLLAKKVRVDPDAARSLYRRSIGLIAMVMVPLLLALALVAHFGITLWLGREFADRAYVVVVVLSAGILFNSMAQVPYATIQATGNARITALVHLSEFVVYVPVIYIGVTNFGIIGAAVAWTIRAIADCLILHHLAVRSIEVQQ